MTQQEAQKILNTQIETISGNLNDPYSEAYKNRMIVPSIGMKAGDFGKIISYINDNGTLKYRVENKENPVGHLRVCSQIEINNK